MQISGLGLRCYSLTRQGTQKKSTFGEKDVAFRSKHTEYFHSLKNLLVLHPFILPQDPWQPLIFLLFR